VVNTYGSAIPYPGYGVLFRTEDSIRRAPTSPVPSARARVPIPSGFHTQETGYGSPSSFHTHDMVDRIRPSISLFFHSAHKLGFYKDELGVIH
jgi:hypothetical protein